MSPAGLIDLSDIGELFDVIVEDIGEISRSSAPVRFDCKTDMDMIDPARMDLTFRFLIPHEGRIIKLRHGYSFTVTDPATMNDQEDATVDLLAGLVASTFDKAKYRLAQVGLVHRMDKRQVVQKIHKALRATLTSAGPYA